MKIFKFISILESMANDIEGPPRKSHKKSSSALTLHDVERMYKIGPVYKDGDIFTDCPNVIITEEYVGKVLENWKIVKGKYMQFPGVNEPVRKDYLACLLFHLPTWQNMILVKEHFIVDIELDYAFAA
jgi:hypothetical protein